MAIRCKYVSLHELGKRSNQEDSLYPKLGEVIPDNDLFILCDGMGGHECGEVASQTVCESMSSYILSHPDTDFEAALDAAYNALDAADSSQGKKMGTTMTFLKIDKEACIVAHIGDSRVYQIRPSERSIIYVTRDHSLVNDLVACGELTEEEAKNSKQKNVITRAMQPHQSKRSKADVAILTDVKEGDYFYMCSDGMLEISENEDIVNVISMDISDEEKMEIFKGVTVDNSDNHSAHLIHIIECVEDAQEKIIPTKRKPKKTVYAVIIALVSVLVAFAVYACRKGDYQLEKQEDFPFIRILKDTTLNIKEVDTLKAFDLDTIQEAIEKVDTSSVNHIE